MTEQKQRQPVSVHEYAAGPLFETEPFFGDEIAFAQLIRVVTVNPNIQVMRDVGDGKTVTTPLISETIEKRVVSGPRSAITQ